ncbi:COG4223 family protein [Rhizobium sp.]
MEPEDQSRNSRPKPEPVTIDLGADEIKEVPSADSDGTEDNVTAEAAPETVAETTADSPSAAKPDAAEQAPRSYSGIPNANSAAGTTVNQPKQPESSRSQNSLGLIAASLLGGIIALGGAAGLQYWGVLPSLGTDEKAEASLNLMASDIAALRTQLAEQAAAAPKIDLSPVDTKIAAIEERLKTVPEANGLSADADARITALSEQVKTTETAAATLKTDLETVRAALEMRIEAIEKKLDQPRDDVEVAVAIASAGLKAAIDRGGPFAAELSTLEGIKPDDPAVAELKTFAATGVPSRAKLVADFPGVADTILASTRSDDPNQGFADRLMSSAFSAIQVRPVGEVEGEGPDAIVARMETRLTNGDFAAAATEWDKLPEPAKKASQAYKTSLDARIRVEQLVGSTLNKAVSATKTDG